MVQELAPVAHARSKSRGRVATAGIVRHQADGSWKYALESLAADADAAMRRTLGRPLGSPQGNWFGGCAVGHICAVTGPLLIFGAVIWLTTLVMLVGAITKSAGRVDASRTPWHKSPQVSTLQRFPRMRTRAHQRADCQAPTARRSTGVVVLWQMSSNAPVT